MKQSIFIIALCLLQVKFVCCQDTIRIMTINVNQGVNASLQDIGEKIKSYHPDFVAMQEVDMYPHRLYAPLQFGKNFIAELSYFADMQGVFGKAWDHPNGWDYGDAALSKYSFYKTESYPLKYKEGTESRQLLLIHTIIKGHAICFGVTHLCHADSSNRVMQLKQIRNIMRKQKEKIQIVCGDFNSTPRENIVHPIMKNWEDALPDKEPTFSCEQDKWYYKALKVDYILYNNKTYKGFKVINHEITCAPEITDHCICIADIVIY